MIDSFSHKGLKSLYQDDTHVGLNPNHVAKIKRILSKLDSASNSNDMNVPGWNLHRLNKKLNGYWAVTIEKNWRIIFTFNKDNEAASIDYIDYH